MKNRNIHLLLEDLRFVIGLFFAIISVILLAQGSTSSNANNLNTYSGALMGAFAILMLFLSLKGLPAKK